jgi:hypothetical protein
MTDIITVPPPICKKQRTCYGPTIILRLKYLGKNPYNSSLTNITLTNSSAFTIKPLQYKKIFFPVMVISSLPASSFVYAPELLYRLGLHCIVSFIPTNDTCLYTTIYNYTTKTIECQKESLQFYCTTTLTYHNG